MYMNSRKAILVSWTATEFSIINCLVGIIERILTGDQKSSEMTLAKLGLCFPTVKWR